MINLEISITLGVALFAFFIVLYLLQRSGARSRKVAQDKETLRLAKALNCDTRDNANQILMGLPPFFIKSEKADAITGESRTVIIAGLLIFLVFLGLAIHLLSIGFMEPAAFAFAFGLGCVLLLVYSKRKILQGKNEVEQLRVALQQYENKLITNGSKAQRRREVAGAQPAFEGIGLNQLLELAVDCEAVPQDSTLKRHFLSHILSQVTADLPLRPTDSALKRHYDALLKTKVEQYLAATQAGSSVNSTVDNNPVIKASAPRSTIAISSIPEDSTLRRHVLAGLRCSIEEDFGGKPTDSTLKRHFNARVDAELEQRINILSSAADLLPEKSVFDPELTATDRQESEVLEHVPEDAVLRRHFLTQLRMAIEARLPPKPTDCNLLRHYRTLVQTKLERELEEHYYF